MYIQIYGVDECWMDEFKTKKVFVTVEGDYGDMKAVLCHHGVLLHDLWTDL